MNLQVGVGLGVEGLGSRFWCLGFRVLCYGFPGFRVLAFWLLGSGWSGCDVLNCSWGLGFASQGILRLVEALSWGHGPSQPLLHNTGAYRITNTILAFPYYSFGITYPQDFLIITKAPQACSLRALRL